jgi:hypothetical protein
LMASRTFLLPAVMLHNASSARTLFARVKVRGLRGCAT